MLTNRDQSTVSGLRRGFQLDVERVRIRLTLFAMYAIAHRMRFALH